jgi:hypothetical protein
MSMMSDEFAVYLPAVNDTYANGIIAEISSDRPFPASFTFRDLEFWKKGSQLWHHPHFLNSAGNYKVGQTPDNAVTRRGWTDGVLFGDSGGFQIGKGKLEGVEGLQPDMSATDACAVWRDAYAARVWILNWLETYANYAMTIDMPLWATSPSGAASPFHHCSPQQLIDLTVENLRFIDTHRLNRTKWLNVIQGSDMPAITQWWDAVKWFPSSGYAMSSAAGKISGLQAVIAPLLMMRDDDAFVAGRDWIHFLGVSTAPWAVMLTAVQRAMQGTTNSRLRISYDSSSPFQLAAKYEKYVAQPELGMDPADWKIRDFPAPQSRLHVGSSASLPFTSPIADNLTLGDMNVRSGMFTERQFDTTSLLFLSNHNVWTYLNTFQAANRAAFLDPQWPIPPHYRECIDVIAEAFSVENWQTFLKTQAMLLAGFKG